ncbi:hypothetical protein LCGC14_1187560 [marine sediment metagenome]|uniref:Uncharacterized protein n=1 Tax=marine sediment metagenome TaxID=412755 RepID=A0A0F9M815_9ZZZZ
MNKKLFFVLAILLLIPSVNALCIPFLQDCSPDIILIQRGSNEDVNYTWLDTMEFAFEQPAKNVDIEIIGAQLIISSSSSISSGSPINISTGISKLKLEVLSGADTIGDITVNAVKHDRDTGVTTEPFSETLALNGVGDSNMTAEWIGNKTASDDINLTTTNFDGDLELTQWSFYQNLQEDFNIIRISVTIETADTAAAKSFDFNLFKIADDGTVLTLVTFNDIDFAPNGIVRDRIYRLDRNCTDENCFINGLTQGIHAAFDQVNIETVEIIITYEFTRQLQVSGVAGDNVTRLFAGSNISLSPSNGLGNVTVNSTGGGAGGFYFPGASLTLSDGNFFNVNDNNLFQNFVTNDGNFVRLNPTAIQQINNFDLNVAENLNIGKNLGVGLPADSIAKVYILDTGTRLTPVNSGTSMLMQHSGEITSTPLLSTISGDDGASQWTWGVESDQLHGRLIYNPDEDLSVSSSLRLIVDSAEIVRFKQQRVGIDDTSPDYKLETVGSDGSGYFGVTNVSDGDILEINSSGNLSSGGSYATGGNTLTGLTSGDINVGTVFYDTLTAKSPVYFESIDGNYTIFCYDAKLDSGDTVLVGEWTEVKTKSTLEIALTWLSSFINEDDSQPEFSVEKRILVNHPACIEKQERINDKRTLEVQKRIEIETCEEGSNTDWIGNLDGSCLSLQEACGFHKGDFDSVTKVCKDIILVVEPDLPEDL